MDQHGPEKPERDDEGPLAERLCRHVQHLADSIGPRHLGRAGSLEAACAFVKHEFKNLGDEVQRQTYDVADTEVVNLVIERRGTHQPDEVVILGAHYDTVASTPGADDNASAVAALIEVARLLRACPARRTVRFVAFACEEPPHSFTDTMGSRVYARQCRTHGEQIVGMLCLEMVGYYCSEPDSQEVPPGIPRYLRWAFPSRGNFLASVGNLRSWRLCWTFRRGFKKAVRFPLFSIVLPETIEEIRLSDNSSFWDQGFPALMLTDTSFLRNPHYHLSSDTPKTLDYARLAQVTLGVAGGLSRLAKAAR